MTVPRGNVRVGSTSAHCGDERECLFFPSWTFIPRNTPIAKKLTPLIAGKIVGADGMAEIGPAALAPVSDHAGGTEIGFEACVLLTPSACDGAILPPLWPARPAIWKMSVKPTIAVRESWG